MSVSTVSSASVAPVASSVHSAAPTAARAADGDFKTAGKGHMVKDADGDYKPTAASSTASSTLSALSLLKKGGS